MTNSYRITKTETANDHYFRRECLEIMGIPETVDNNDFGKRVCQIFGGIGVRVKLDSLEAINRLKNKNRTIVKFCSYAREIANK